MATRPAVCKFSIFFRGSMPSNPPRVLYILNMLQNNSARKLRLKIWRNWVLPPEKISDYAPDMKTFFKGLIYAFLGF